MKKWWLNGVCMMLVGALTVFAIGCGDDKGSGSDSLTTEEQYTVITEYFTFDPDDDSTAVDVTGIALGLLSGEYWDGVDTADATVLAKRVIPSAKRVSNDDDSLYVDYNFVSGWWVIYYRVSDSGELGSFELAFRDSVRYQDSEGHAQFEPDESTNRIDLTQQLTSHVSGSPQGLAAAEGDHFELGTSANSRFVVVRSAADMAQVDGFAGVNFNLDAATNDSAAVIGFDLQAEYDELMIPIGQFDGEPCPTGGEVSAGLDISVSVQAGDETAEAEGSWDASINFTGGGNATVDIQSGDFSEEYSGQACDPPAR